MLCYCNKCGRLAEWYSNEEKKCDFCNNIVQPVPNEYLEEEKKRAIIDELKDEFMEKYIWSSFEYDPELHEQMKQWLDTRWIDKPSKKVGNKYGIECPHCHSTYIKRIGGITRALFTDASAVGKQFQCIKCKAYF
ncbi:MAG: hypothetical protein K2J67_02075 [Lachnospiraceae bacterium]|nr:hypothetical protein [Lachnospiraceae bacterium]